MITTSRMKSLLAIWVCILAVVANASTIICTNVIDFTGSGYGATTVRFTPINQYPQPYLGTNGFDFTVIPKPITVNITNNAFSASILAGGIYSFNFYPQNTFVKGGQILVPSNDQNT